MRKITLSLCLLIFCFSNHFAQEIDSAFIKQHTFYNLEEAIKNPEQVYGLDLSGQNLTEFPIKILKLINLRTLNLSVNKITEIPDEISKLTNLTTIRLYNNNLNTLPESIGDLKNLNELDCRKNQLMMLPESIGNLKNLNKFFCSRNKLRDLPQSIRNLTNLNELYCTKNQLTNLPDSMGNLINLVLFDCSDNELNYLPESIGNMRSLTYFYCGMNRLGSLPESLLNLKELKYFDCYSNPFTTIPVSLKDILSKLDYGHSEAIKSILNAPDIEDEILTEVEIQPGFEGGMEVFYEYLRNNLRYPKIARRRGIQGRVFIQYIVDREGVIDDVKVVKGIGGGCDEEAMRVMQESPLWIPAKLGGRPVKVKIVIPIVFKLGR